MAVPFRPEEEEPEEQLQRLITLFGELVRLLTAVLESNTAPPRAPVARSRLPSCEEQADEEDEDEPEPPGVAVAPVSAALADALVDTDSALPDVVPRAAPRQSLARQPRWPASPFTKYITASTPGTSTETPASVSTPLSSTTPATPSTTTSPCSTAQDAPQVRAPVAVSATTLCYRLPDVVCDAVGAASCPAPAPRTAPRTSPALGPTLGVGHLTPKPAPRWRRSRAALKCPAPGGLAGPAPGALQGDELEHALCKMAAGDSWLRVGQQLRSIADQLHLPDEVDGPAAEPPESARPSGLLSLLLPKPTKHKGTFLTTAVVLLVGWRLLACVR